MPRSPGGSPSTTALTLQVCSYNALTDLQTVVFDLNDKVTTFIHGGSFKQPQPDKVWVRSSNIRTPGEKISKFQYRNRHIMASIWIRGANTTAIQATQRALIAAIEQPPYVLCLALPNAANFTYADVVAVKHTIPADPIQVLGGAQTHIELDFECRPGLRGDRLTLQNLVNNPGFEAPSGPGMQAFSDNFANVNVYAVQSGSAPTVTANVMTIPNGTRVAFGSPAWGAINTWQVRFQFATGLTASYYLHFTDANNWLRVDVASTGIDIQHDVGGTIHTLTTGSYTALTNGTFYWVKITQFPTVASSTPPFLTATLFNDSAGAIGAAIAGSNISAAAFDSVTALTGRPQILASGANLLIGGNFGQVHALWLFGPGGWAYVGNNGGTTGTSSGAWELTNTYPNGPVTSFGAARIELPPAGGIDTYWAGYLGGTPAGTMAMPIQAVGNVVAASVWFSTIGLANSTVTLLSIQEFDSSGTQLRSTILQQLSGNFPAWTQLSGTVTTGANCAYVAAALRVVDGNAGVSANGTIFFDNVQVWNKTTVAANNPAQTTMPYCEMRFPQSPAQLLVSGLVGDIATPAWVGASTFQANWTAGSSLTFLCGSRAQPTAGGALVASLIDFPGGATGVLDSSSYGGFYQAKAASNNMEPQAFIAHNADLLGVYHLYARLWTGQGVSFLGKVITKATVFDGTLASLAQTFGYDQFVGPSLSPFAASTTWTLADTGQVNLPAAARGGLVDNTLTYVLVAVIFQDTSGQPAAVQQINWAMLLPVDGSLLSATLTNSAFSQFTATNSWIWLYSDPTAPDRVSWTTGATTTSLPNPAASAGASAPPSIGSQSTNPAVDPYLVLDPTLKVGGVAVNQFAALLMGGSASVLPVTTEMQYAPLYLTLR